VWPVRFTEAARVELSEARDWYEAEAPGLGQRFRAEIDSVVQLMADNPRQFPAVYRFELSKRLRRDLGEGPARSRIKPAVLG
jgi:plasmid stabilization system protein ParE